MNTKLYREAFEATDLYKVPRPDNPVVLVSGGGPILNLLSEKDGFGLCEWTQEDGKLCRGVFHLACLYKCTDMGGYQR